METNNITKGIIGLIILLAGFGGGIYLTSEQIESTYVCPLNEQVVVFDRLSSSGKTGYYIDEFNEEQSVACRVSRTYESWMNIEEYSKIKGININDLLENGGSTNEGIPSPTKGTEWKCSPSECIRIN